MIKEDKDFLNEVKIATGFFKDGLMNSQSLKKILMRLYDRLDKIEAEKRNKKIKG